MSLGLVGRKVGMTRIFTAEGDSIPVTVLDVSDNRVTQIKSGATDGYSAVQVTFGKRRASRVSKPQFAGLPSSPPMHRTNYAHHSPPSRATWLSCSAIWRNFRQRNAGACWLMLMEKHSASHSWWRSY